MRIAWPIRALWAWPIATAAVTAAELTVRSSRQAFDVVAFTLGVATGATMGAWLAVISALLSVLAERRGWSWPERWRPGPNVVVRLAVGAVLGLAIAAVGWWLVDIAMDVLGARPTDYDQTLQQLWRAAVLLGAPLAGVGVLFVAAALTRWLTPGGRASRALRASAGVALVWAAAHFSSGSFVVYFGSAVAFVLVLALAAVGASWLPSRATGVAATLAVTGLVACFVLGYVGLRHTGARALLLHHGRLTTTIASIGIGWLDGDGDGELPPWLGGADCDDDEPTIGAARPELADNGIDDNCWGGDRSDRPRVEPVTREPAGRRPALLLVTIDTVRADHLELYGAARQTMPALTALAGSGLVFERAYSPSNHTFYSMMSILAGQSPESMLVATPDGVPKLRFSRWLPDELRKRGYHVVAIAPPLVVDGKLRPEELRVDELDLGPFDTGGKNRGTTSRQLADAAIRRIEGWEGEQPLAIWVHFMDPHAVHESPVRFAGSDVVDAYDNELSWVDMHLGRVVGAMAKRHGEDAVIAVTADHGESFGEDGDWGHGFTLFERDVKVPLVLAGKGVPLGRRADPVSSVALVETVLGLLDGEPGGLLADARSSVVVANPAFLWNELRMEAALVEADRKLVWARLTNTYQLFDLAADPGERRNLAAAEPETLGRMQNALRDALEGGG